MLMPSGRMSAAGAGAGAPLEPLIVRVRGQRVILDADLVRLYGVNTKVLNQAVKRNAERFPEDFAFQLTAVEAEILRSQIVTSRSQDIDFFDKKVNWSQFVTSSHDGKRYLPWVFTEHGALMAANILRSTHAVQISVFVIRAFVRLCEQVAANTVIINRLEEIDKTLLQHDTALRDIYHKLLPLLLPAPEPSKRRIGFIADNDCGNRDRLATVWVFPVSAYRPYNKNV